jgi:hypothetical protein
MFIEETEREALRTPAVMLAIANLVKKARTDLEFEYKEWEDERGHTRRTLTKVVGDWRDLPVALSYRNVAYALAQAHFEEEGVVGASMKLLTPTAKDYDYELRRRKLLKSGSEAFNEMTGLPFAPVTGYFFSQVYRAVADDNDALALLNEDTLTLTEIVGSLPSKPHSYADDPDEPPQPYGGKQEGVAIFPNGTRSPLYLAWRKRVTENGRKGLLTLADDSFDGVGLKYDRSRLDRASAVMLEKLPQSNA